MRTPALILASLLAAATVSPLAGEARADEKVLPKPKATKASVLARKQKLAKARDAMRALAQTPAPSGLTAAQKKTYVAEMKNLVAIADTTDTVVKTIDAKLEKAESDLDSMSEMGEMESLRLQNAMDRMAKMMETLSNLLKKISDTANSITQNLK